MPKLDKRAMPEGFAADLAVLGSWGCARKHSASLTTVTRWRLEIGIVPNARVMRSRRRGRSVRCIETGATFMTIAEAVAWCRTNGNMLAQWTAINRAASTPRRRAYGFSWAYA